MRSRFTAYALGRMEYIAATQAEKLPEPTSEASDEVRWFRLRIHESRDGGSQHDEGWVAFTAFYDQSGRRSHLTENSFFRRDNGRWQYVQAKSHTNLSFKDYCAETPRRNDPCICGSNKKYKRCCMNA